MRRTAPLACSLLLCAPLAQAADTGSYAGLHAGLGQYDYTNPPAGSRSGFCDPAASSCDKRDVGYKLYAGYLFNRYLGVEGSAWSMGDGKLTYNNFFGTTLTQTVRLNGYGLSFVGGVPLGRAHVVARAGYAASTVTRKDSLGGVQVGRFEKTRTDPVFGAGAGVRVWNDLHVRLDWDRARGRTQFGEKFEADLFSLGLMYVFGPVGK